MTQRTYGDKPEASSSSVNTSSLIENGEVKEKLINQNEESKNDLTHVHEEVEEDFESEDLSNDSPKSGSRSGSEYSAFVHENAVESENEVYEPCKCVRCAPEISNFGKLIAYIDHNWFKKLLVYNYSPENIKAQNDV